MWRETVKAIEAVIDPAIPLGLWPVCLLLMIAAVIVLQKLLRTCERIKPAKTKLPKIDGDNTPEDWNVDSHSLGID